MHAVYRLLLVIAFAASGCGPAPTATGSPRGEIEAMLEQGIHITEGQYQIEIRSRPPDPDAQLVTYFILRPDNENYLFQLSGTGAKQGFPIGLSRKRFYNGTYTIRAHVGSNPEPFDTKTWEYTGYSEADEIDDRLQDNI